ncbi:Fur family transcriptional regulator [Clostridium estertheticum]|uniref:Transcriptional repressor n=2 Tax=Clostridium estertheticum TaxID=238834 RepID=A0A1J0GKI6_9CLOT|nr:Fur family transcriptional regulator [Clostridium estertheticum]APC41884.1 transcriptional repressor [Clostridium estertheticum subsp. estertheticum]MBU3073265.1 transcriptional repressor [Clostridium estertheticum]MBU3163494.1 transcriptional repressor [Clostridium estertheticum]MBU3173231.1 transcriptional repressor [Clostridium estertheticum]MBU3185258.1 transcriptional repressor [Clostridium estertheticum]
MNVISYLKDNNIRVTKARKSILEIILESSDAINVNVIYDLLKKEDIKIDLSTVYRTLDLLESKKIVNKFDLGNNMYNYIINNNSHKHIIECDLCHKKMVIDCPIPQIEEQIKAKTGITLTESHVYLKGICKDCKK